MNQSRVIIVTAIVTSIFNMIAVLAVQALAFTEPSSAPPAGDVAAPLNTGGSTQDKSGWFTFQGGGTRADTYLATVSGKVGVGNTSPAQELDVTGYVNGRTGLCIAGSCRTTWPAGATSGTAIYLCSGSFLSGSGPDNNPIYSTIYYLSTTACGSYAGHLMP